MARISRQITIATWMKQVSSSGCRCIVAQQVTVLVSVQHAVQQAAIEVVCVKKVGDVRVGRRLQSDHRHVPPVEES
jgi:predicted ATPase